MVDIDELRRLEADAKPVPWRLETDGQDMRLMSDADPEIASWTFAVRPWSPADWDECDLTDQLLIVAMRNALPELIEELTTARAELARYRGITQEFGARVERSVDDDALAQQAVTGSGWAH